MKIDIESVPPTAVEIESEREKLEAAKAVVAARKRLCLLGFWVCAVLFVGFIPASMAWSTTETSRWMLAAPFICCAGVFLFLMLYDHYWRRNIALSAGLRKVHEVSRHDAETAQQYAAALEDPTVMAYHRQILSAGRAPVLAEADVAIGWAERAREQEATTRALERIGMGMVGNPQTG